MSNIRVHVTVAHKTQMVITKAEYEVLVAAILRKFTKELKKKRWSIFLQRPSGAVEITSDFNLHEQLVNDSRLLVLEDGVAAPVGGKLTKKQKEAIEAISWLRIGESGGRLAARGRPSGDQVAALAECEGLTVVVTLLLGDEEGCAEVELACQRAKIRWLHAPLDGLRDVRDFDSNPQALRSLAKVYETVALLRNGESVMVHCAAGLHRTGTFLWLLFALLSVPTDKILAQIKLVRQATADEVRTKKIDEQAAKILPIINKAMASSKFTMRSSSAAVANVTDAVAAADAAKVEGAANAVGATEVANMTEDVRAPDSPDAGDATSAADAANTAVLER